MHQTWQTRSVSTKTYRSLNISISSLESGFSVAMHVEITDNHDNQHWTPRIHVVTVLWLDSDDVVTSFSPTTGTSGRLQTVFLCHLDSYTVTVCNEYLIVVSSHVGETGDNCNTGHVVTGDPTPRENDLRWLF